MASITIMCPDTALSAAALSAAGFPAPHAGVAADAKPAAPAVRLTDAQGSPPREHVPA